MERIRSFFEGAWVVPVFTLGAILFALAMEFALRMASWMQKQRGGRRRAAIADDRRAGRWFRGRRGAAHLVFVHANMN